MTLYARIEEKHDGTSVSRRSFATALAAGLAALGLPSGRAMAATVSSPPDLVKCNIPGFGPRLLETVGPGADDVRGAPSVPAGLNYYRMSTGLLHDGFVASPKQLGVYYQSLQNESHRPGLSIILAAKPAAILMGCNRRIPEAQSLPVGDGTIVNGCYFDGQWVPGAGDEPARFGPTNVPQHWSREYTHSVVVDTGRLLVAVRGTRHIRVTRAHLLGVAASLLAHGRSVDVSSWFMEPGTDGCFGAR